MGRDFQQEISFMVNFCAEPNMPAGWNQGPYELSDQFNAGIKRAATNICKRADMKADLDCHNDLAKQCSNYITEFIKSANQENKSFKGVSRCVFGHLKEIGQEMCTESCKNRRLFKKSLKKLKHH